MLKREGIAANVAGLSARSLTLGGAFTAVVLGLAAQQTLSNLFAGLVLLSARPFRVGERVKLQGAGITAEGVVSQLGLLYTVFADGEDEIMIPNSVVLNVAVVPLREPDAVDMRARLRPGVTPTDIQNMLEERLDTPLLDRPRIILEELDGDEVVVRIQATPVASNDGPRLATEILSAVSSETRSSEERAAEHEAAARSSNGLSRIVAPWRRSSMKPAAPRLEATRTLKFRFGPTRALLLAIRKGQPGAPALAAAAETRTRWRLASPSQVRRAYPTVVPSAVAPRSSTRPRFSTRATWPSRTT